MTKKNWFPQVLCAEDIYILDCFEYSFKENDIFNLFNSETKIELKDKVGNLSSSEGSAKFSARLIEVNGYIIKTDITLASENLEKLKKDLSKKCFTSRKLKIYHPSKEWFIIKFEDKYLPCSICKKLYTLHNISDLNKRLEYFLELIKIQLNIIKTHDLELDLNPSNFAYEQTDINTLYYLDDEIYEKADLKSVGEFIIHRIRNEANISEDLWQNFAEQLSHVVKSYLTAYYDFQEVINGLEEFSLSPQFFPKRDIIIEILKNNFFNKFPYSKTSNKSINTNLNIISNRKEASDTNSDILQDTKDKQEYNIVLNDISNLKEVIEPKKITCVMADIHSNLPALESVLNEAKNLGVTDYIILGDIVGYGPFPNETMEVVMKLPNLITIQGNHDYSVANNNLDLGMSKLGSKTADWTFNQLDENKLSWLRDLKTKHYNQEHNYMYIHGSVIDERNFLAYIYEMSYEENLKKADEMNLNYVLFGHTHVPFIYYINRKTKACFKQKPSNIQLFQEDKTLLINPGSVGQPRDRITKASFAIIDEENNLSFHRVEYDISKTTKEIEKIGLFPELIKRLEKGI